MSIFTRLFARRSPSPTRTARRTTLGCTALEARDVPAAFTAALTGGTLYVVGTEGADSINVVTTNNQVRVNQGFAGTGDSPITWNGVKLSAVPLSWVNRVVVYAGGGDDTVMVGAFGGAAVSAEVYGGAGNDFIATGAGNDTIFGEGGDDTLMGGAGDDTIYGGDGNDTIYGSDGNDTLFGGYGNDTMYGGNGSDTMYGDGNDDTMYGGEGNDTLFGGEGNDHMYGENGNDTMYGENGNDFVLGGAGIDAVYGNSGVNYVDAGGSVGDVQFSGGQTAGFVPYSGGATVRTLGVTGQATTVFSQPVVFTPAQSWAAAQPGVADALKSKLGEGGLIGGQTLRDIDVSLGTAAETAIATAADGSIAVRLTIRNNSVTATCTTPTVFGSWADPRMTVGFDLRVTITLTANGRIAVGGVAAAAVNVRLTGDNLSGTVVEWGSKVVKAFGGPSVPTAVGGQLDRQDIAGSFRATLDRQVAALGTALARFGNPSAPRYNLSFDAATGNLIVTSVVQTF